MSRMQDNRSGKAAVRLRSAGACALRLLVTFSLAFSFTLSAQLAFANADEGGAAGGVAGASAVAVQEGEGASSPSAAVDPPTEPDPPEPEAPYVTDMGIYVKPALVGDPIDVLCTALSPVIPPAQHQTISARGGQIDFDAVAYWNDYSENYDYANVTWSLDPGNEAIASISRDTGVLVANGTTNGTVVVTATLKEGLAKDGAQVATKVAVDVIGQESGPYVTRIVLCDETGTPIDPSYTFLDESLATAMIEIRAKVTVHDPTSGADAIYEVKSGNGLSAQTGGALADLAWWVMVGEMGVVSDDGVYRPTREGQNIVFASGQGENGTSVEGSAAIILPGEDEAHPQDSLTVDVVWSDFPDQVVASKTFSVADMESLGTQTLSYTAISDRGFGFKSYTGCGPYLADVLKAAGVNVDQLDELAKLHPDNPPRLRFDSIDNPAERSWPELVGTARYYYPYAQYGNYGGGVQVAPMVAIESAYAGDNVSSPVPEKMNSNERFRLLYGASEDREPTTSFQRKWVNAIHVVLPGAPPVQNQNDEGVAEDEEEEEDEPEKQAGIGGGMNTAGGGGDNAGTPTSSGGSGNESGNTNSNPGAWSVLSAVNKNAANVPGIELDNPFGPFTAAASVGVFAAGGVEALVRWRWQKRTPAKSLA